MHSDHKAFPDMPTILAVFMTLAALAFVLFVTLADIRVKHDLVQAVNDHNAMAHKDVLGGGSANISKLLSLAGQDDTRENIFNGSFAIGQLHVRKLACEAVGLGAGFPDEEASEKGIRDFSVFVTNALGRNDAMEALKRYVAGNLAEKRALASYGTAMVSPEYCANAATYIVKAYAALAE